MKNNHNRYKHFLLFFAIGTGIICLFAYHRSFEIQNRLVRFIIGNFQFFEKYAYSHNSQIYETMGSHYLRVLIWLLPAWMLLSLGLIGLARTRWLRSFVSLIHHYTTCFVIGLAIMTSLCSFGIATFVLEYHPITEGDEYGYTFQAKLFASGRIYGTVGANMEEFSNWAIISKGPRRYNVHLPGHALILVLGLLVGNVYLIPSILAGISVLLLFVIAKDIFSKETALIAAVLMATSPFYLIFHGTRLPQTSLIPCLLLFLLSTIRIIERGKWYWYVIVSIALALATFIRPPSIVLFAGPIGFYLLLVRNLPLQRRILFVVVSFLTIFFGTMALCIYSSKVSGQPLSFTPSGMSAHPPGHGPFSGKLGFSGRVGHTPIRGIVNTAKALIGWNYLLFGWPISFLPIAIWIIRRDKSGWEYVFMGSVTCYFIFYFLWHASLWHYYLDTIPLFALVSACAINRCCTRSHPEEHVHLKRKDNHIRSVTEVSERIRVCDPPHIKRIEKLAGPNLLHMFFIVGVVLSLFSWPSSVAYLRNRSAPVRDISKAIYEANVKNAIVLLDNNLPGEMYSAIGRNSPDLDDDVILAKKLPDDQWRRTVAMFPGRSVWILRGDSNNDLVCSPFYWKRATDEST